jgi:hypothetical protein
VSNVSSAGRDVLVVGSFPPIPTAGAAITVDVVRRLWSEGARPHVAAPRASAAPMTVAVTGWTAGKRLEELRLTTNAQDVVVCVERDLPIPTSGFSAGLLPIVQHATVVGVVRALAGFDHVTLIACGDLGVPAELWAQLIFAADVVIDHQEATGTPGVTTLGERHPVRVVLYGLATRLLGSRTSGILRLARRGVRVARPAPRGR